MLYCISGRHGRTKIYSVTTARTVSKPRVTGSQHLKGGFYLAEKAETFMHSLQTQRTKLRSFNVLNSLTWGPTRWADITSQFSVPQHAQIHVDLFPIKGP